MNPNSRSVTTAAVAVLTGSLLAWGAGARGEDLSPQSMFFQGRTLGGQWDTWLYHHEGTYYLFLLAGPGGNWHGIGMATSPDGVHWTDRGLVLSKARGVTWLGTGSTWKSPGYEKDRKFFLNFSEWRGDRQTIFFAQSTDLLHWTRLDGAYEFKQDERWYEPKGRWDCIYSIARPGGGLFGYWTADPKGRPGVGFGESLDGVRWTALPPPRFLDGAPHGECGAVERFGDRYFMMLGSNGEMLTLVADRPEGPFRPARKNYHLLGGHTYFSRFFSAPDGILVNHHSMAGGVYFAPLKQAVVDAEGTLRLKWWKGNERLKHRPLDVRPPRDNASPVAMLDNTFDIGAGVVLEGTFTAQTSAGQKSLGLFIEHPDRSGTALLLRRDGVAEIGPMQADGAGFAVKSRVDHQLPLHPVTRFRLLMKYSLLELYLDDHLIQCWSVPGCPTGRIGLVGRGIENLRAWQ
jgi:hypothetical protein